jgi:hypothetical protein
MSEQNVIVRLSASGRTISKLQGIVDPDSLGTVIGKSGWLYDMRGGELIMLKGDADWLLAHSLRFEVVGITDRKLSFGSQEPWVEVRP